jgi:hypothetical protein
VIYPVEGHWYRRQPSAARVQVASGTQQPCLSNNQSGRAGGMGDGGIGSCFQRRRGKLPKKRVRPLRHRRRDCPAGRARHRLHGRRAAVYLAQPAGRGVQLDLGCTSIGGANAGTRSGEGSIAAIGDGLRRTLCLRYVRASYVKYTPCSAPSSLPRHHRVVQPVMRQPRVAVDARVPQRGVFVAAEGKDGLVHLLGVEDPELDEQVEVLDGQAGDG